MHWHNSKEQKICQENQIQKDFITNKKSYYNKENLREKWMLSLVKKKENASLFSKFLTVFGIILYSYSEMLIKEYRCYICSYTCHISIWLNWRCSSTHSSPQHQMEVSVNLTPQGNSL
jgi:hypothetical protein